MSSIQSSSNLNEASILNETSYQIKTIEQAKETFYTKEQVQEILRPIMNYLEILSNTYEIKLNSGLLLTYKKPSL